MKLTKSIAIILAAVGLLAVPGFAKEYDNNIIYKNGTPLTMVTKKGIDMKVIYTLADMPKGALLTNTIFKISCLNDKGEYYGGGIAFGHCETEGNVKGNVASGFGSMAFGIGCEALGDFSVAQGGAYWAKNYDAIVNVHNGRSVRDLEAAIRAGTLGESKIYAIGYGSHAEGAANYAVGDWSHVEGGNSWAYGMHSHAEGECSMTGCPADPPTTIAANKKSVDWSDTILNNVNTKPLENAGYGSFAVVGGKAIGSYSVALGGTTHLKADGSVAINGTTGMYGETCGGSAIAMGNGAWALGSNSVAIGGAKTEKEASGAVAIGKDAVATNSGEVVIGGSNITLNVSGNGKVNIKFANANSTTTMVQLAERIEIEGHSLKDIIIAVMESNPSGSLQ